MGAKKVLKPLGVCASSIVIDESVADENHLKPSIRQGPRGILDADASSEMGAYVAIVSVPETSLPPLLSVIHCPLVQAFRGSREVTRSYAS